MCKEEFFNVLYWGVPKNLDELHKQALESLYDLIVRCGFKTDSLAKFRLIDQAVAFSVRDEDFIELLKKILLTTNDYRYPFEILRIVKKAKEYECLDQTFFDVYF